MEDREQVAFEKVGHGYGVLAVSVRSAEESWAEAHVMQMTTAVFILFYK